MRFMICERREGLLNITIERGWWIFKWIETWKGSTNVGWVKNGKAPPARVDAYLTDLAWQYWKQWSD